MMLKHFALTELLALVIKILLGMQVATSQGFGLFKNEMQKPQNTIMRNLEAAINVTEICDKISDEGNSTNT